MCLKNRWTTHRQPVHLSEGVEAATEIRKRFGTPYSVAFCNHSPKNFSDVYTTVFTDQPKELLAACLDRLNRGEKLDADQIVAEHPQVGEAVLKDLDAFINLSEGPEHGTSLGTLGDYKLNRQIGRGGMGVVYEAWQNSMNRKVALKVLPAGIAADSKACLRFMREAQAAGKLSHPNIVAVHAMGVDENTPYYAMEMVEGETLAEILRKLKPAGEHGEAKEQALTSLAGLLEKERVSAEAVTVDSKLQPPVQDVAGPKASSNAEGITPAYCRRLAESFASVADGIHYAHQNGVIHRDIKPSNLMLDKTGKLRVLDFGLARLEGEQSLTLTGDFLGTVLYVSPEQAMVRRVAVDHRTDIYSLGATMYEMLSWRPPFEGKSSQDTLGQIIFRDPKPLRRSNPRIPRDLETIVLKCLRKDPKDRYATAEALGQDLRRFARGEPIEARPQPRWEKLARRGWRHKVRIGAAAVLLVLLGILGHFVLGRNGMAIRKVWNVPYGVEPTAVSRDGGLLACADHRADTSLLVLDLVTLKDRQITITDSGDFSEGIIFSPNGNEVAYAWSTEDEAYELRIGALDGSQSRVLYSDRECDHLHAEDWSPDGKEILAVSATEDGTAQIVLVSVADGSAEILKTFSERFPWPVRFSPDGQAIAYSLWSPQGSSADIYLLPRDPGGGNGKEAPLVEHATDKLLGWAPDGRILFTTDRSGTWDAWLLQLSGGKPGRTERLRPGIAHIKPLGFTADGSYYYRVDARVSDVYTAMLDPATGNVLGPPAPVGQRAGEKTTPVWSPDGESLAYVTWRGIGSTRRSTIYICSVTTPKERELPSGFRRISTNSWWHMSWSADSRFLLVLGTDLQGRQGIHRIDAKTNDIVMVKQRGENLIHWPTWRGDGMILYSERVPAPTWRMRVVLKDLKNPAAKEKELALSGRAMFCVSPDNQQLAVVDRDADKAQFLQIVSIGDGTSRKLLRVDQNDGIGYYAWAPDGQRLACVIGGGQTRTLNVVEVTDGQTTELVRYGQQEWIGQFVWSPDGRHLLYLKGRASVEDTELWRISTAGQGPPKLQFSMKGIKHLCIRPDGKQLAFHALLEGESDAIWVMENFLPPLDSEE